MIKVSYQGEAVLWLFVQMRALLTVSFLCCGSSANSCRGSQRVFVREPLICIYICVPVRVCARSHCLFFHLPAGPVLFPGCRCCSELTSCLLPLLFLRIRGLQPFPVGGEEETIGNRMSIPGRKGQGGLGDAEGGGRRPWKWERGQ